MVFVGCSQSTVMPPLSGTTRLLSCLSLLWTLAPAQADQPCCSASSPVGPPHPVRALLETFDAGPGCSARQRGHKETHVVAVGTATDADNKVTVLLQPLAPSSSLRPVHLLLSSRLPVRWWLEADGLPDGLPVQVQVSSTSSVEASSLLLSIRSLGFLPFRPQVLHRWALAHQGNLSSMTHSASANRVYVGLGEDPTQPAACQLQAHFLSRHYMTSDLRPQEARGCVCPPVGGSSPEVHVVKLHSTGSGLCGSVQVEVIVSLLPPGPKSRPQQVVLVLSSSVPVNWTINAPGVRGHVSVRASDTVTPPYPPESDLTLSSSRLSDLSTGPDVLAWVRRSGFHRVASYTEAELANRVVIQLAGGGTGPVTERVPAGSTDTLAAPNPPRAEEPKGGGDALTVQCEDGRISAAVAPQAVSDPVAAVTLRDLTCRAQFNGSHFLLLFPVVSCGTEVLLLSRPGGVRYQNTVKGNRRLSYAYTLTPAPNRTSKVLFWRDGPQNGTGPEPLLGIHLDCLASVPGSPGPDTEPPQTGPVPWGRRPDPELSRLPTLGRKRGPVLALRLFVSERYERSRVGPCVVPADHRIYAEISADGPVTEVAEVTSCVVSPLSDPKKSPVWFVIRDGCSSDPSLVLPAAPGDEEGGSETTEPLRFSFVLRPLYNDSVQFLHCSLRLCDPSEPRAAGVCHGGRRIPALGPKSPGPQVPEPPVLRPPCEIRTLSRPVVVTQSVTSLVPKPPRPPAGQRTRSLSTPPPVVPQPPEPGPELQSGAVMGVVLLSFVMGVSLMGGLWCIYSCTGGRDPSLRGGRGYLPDQNPAEQPAWKPPAASDQSCSSV